MLSACVIYKINTELNMDDLYDKLTSGFSHTEEAENLSQDLLTDVANVQRTERGVEFILRYDKEDTRPVRESEDPWYPALHKVTIRVTDQYFILNGYTSRHRAAKHTAIVLDLEDDEFEQVEFTASTLIQLVSEDAAELSQGTWENPTEHADSATIWGDVQESSLYAEFNSDGKPTWTRFESSSFPTRETGLSTNKDSVVFGNKWEISEMEDYILDRVIPNL